MRTLWTACLALTALVAACRSGSVAPPLHPAAADPEVSPPAESAGALRLRRDVRPLFEQCAKVHAELARKVDRAERIERWASGAEWVSQRDGLREEPRLRQDNQGMPSGQWTTPIFLPGRDSPLVERPRATRLDAEDQIRALNDIVDATEDFLAHHRDPDAWSPGEGAQWEALEGALRTLCHRTVP